MIITQRTPTLRPLARPALMSVGAITTLLGVLVWSGRAPVLVGPHMLLGVTLFVAVGSVVVSALRAGVSGRVVAPVIGSALVLLALGVAQRSLLPGSLHWIVQVAHVVTGLAAMLTTGRLFARR